MNKSCIYNQLLKARVPRIQLTLIRQIFVTDKPSIFQSSLSAVRFRPLSFGLPDYLGRETARLPRTKPGLNHSLVKATRV